MSKYEVREQPLTHEFGGWSVHAPLRKMYFDWIQKEHPNWTEEEIQKEFKRRLHYFVTDLLSYLQSKDIHALTFVIGGGNSRFLFFSIICLKRFFAINFDA